MSMSPRLSSYLEQSGARYEICAHDQSATSSETARLAHIPEHPLAQSVRLEDDTGVVMAVVPADSRVRIGELAQMLGAMICIWRTSDASRRSSATASPGRCLRSAWPGTWKQSSTMISTRTPTSTSKVAITRRWCA